MEERLLVNMLVLIETFIYYQHTKKYTGVDVFLHICPVVPIN
jgi:hypothetical protein